MIRHKTRGNIQVNVPIQHGCEDDVVRIIQDTNSAGYPLKYLERRPRESHFNWQRSIVYIAVWRTVKIRSTPLNIAEGGTLGILIDRRITDVRNGRNKTGYLHVATSRRGAILIPTESIDYVIVSLWPGYAKPLPSQLSPSHTFHYSAHH